MIATDGAALEAIQSIRAINQAQGGYFLRHSRFGSDFGSLDLDISAETENHRYQIVSSNDQEAVMVAQAKQPGLYSYTSYTSLTIGVSERWEITGTDSFICETDQPSLTPHTEWTIRSLENLECPVGSHRIGSDSFEIEQP